MEQHSGLFYILRGGINLTARHVSGFLRHRVQNENLFSIERMRVYLLSWFDEKRVGDVFGRPHNQMDDCRCSSEIPFVAAPCNFCVGYVITFQLIEQNPLLYNTVVQNINNDDDFNYRETNLPLRLPLASEAGEFRQGQDTSTHLCIR